MTISGLVSGDTPSVLDSSLTITSAAAGSSPVGTYPLTPSGASDADYTITISSFSVGGRWTSVPGNNSSPPSSVPSYVGMLVTSNVTKSGSTISGDIVHLVIVHTQLGYASDPGHPGTGTIVMQIS